MIGPALRALLIADGGFAAIAGTRVYPQQLPQDPVYPAVVYRQMSGRAEYSHDGSSDLDDVRFEFVGFAETAAALNGLMAALRRVLSGFKGPAGSPPIRIQGVFHVMSSDDHAPLAGLARAGPTVFSAAREFQIWFES